MAVLCGPWPAASMASPTSAAAARCPPASASGASSASASPSPAAASLSAPPATSGSCWIRIGCSSSGCTGCSGSLGWCCSCCCSCGCFLGRGGGRGGLGLWPNFLSSLPKVPFLRSSSWQPASRDCPRHRGRRGEGGGVRGRGQAMQVWGFRVFGAGGGWMGAGWVVGVEGGRAGQAGRQARASGTQGGQQARAWRVSAACTRMVLKAA